MKTRLPALLFLLAMLVGCNKQRPDSPELPTVSTLTEASRRLELLGYRYMDETRVLGQHFVTYERATPNANFSVEIVRWSGDQRLMSLNFYSRTNFAAFNSLDARAKILDEIAGDACSMIDGKADYRRAVASMQEVKDSGISRYEGRATTADGWQIGVIEYDGYFTRDEGQKENTMGFVTINLTNVATKEDMTPEAVIEFDRAINPGK